MAEEREVRVSTHSYVSMICLSLFLSFLVFLSVVPSTPGQKHWTELYKFSYIIAQIIVALIIGLVLFWLSFPRTRYHRKQTIFWPKQCRHCAQVLGMLTQWNKCSESSKVQTPPLNHPSSVKLFSESTSQQGSSREGLEGTESQYNNNTSCAGELWYLRRKSLAQAMIILGVIGIVGAPLKFVSFILDQHATLVNVCRVTFAMVLILVVLPATMFSIARYHDAVFVDTPLFSAGFAFLCGGFMWLATFKLFFPISGLFGNASFPYWQNGTGNSVILPSLGASAMSMYAQCAIIGTVFLWTIWSSMIRQHTLHLRESNPQIQPFDPPRSQQVTRDSGTSYRMNVIRYDEDATSHAGDSEEGGQLLQHEGSRPDRLLKPFLHRVLRVSRQDSSKIAEVKWTLATLVYLGFFSAARWLKNSWGDSYEPLEVNFFKREVLAIGLLAVAVLQGIPLRILQSTSGLSLYSGLNVDSQDMLSHSSKSRSVLNSASS
ncbi:uncharacterized protein [Diadema antillarum]|uniref:uncharacterized protein n=1 Tax=Diadema antillarum TaxID=105358 RepID=UPI003A87B1F0